MPNSEFSYDVISEDMLVDLISKVNKKMKEGWIPQGGVAIIKTPNSLLDDSNSYFTYNQAIARITILNSK